MLPPARADSEGVAQIEHTGVDSLLAAQIRAELEREFDVALAIGDILRAGSLDEIAQRIADAIRRSGDRPLELERTADKRFALSDGQRSLWFLQQREPDSCAYNVSAALRVLGPLDVRALESAIELLVQRHESLRTRFGVHAGAPFQEVLETRPIEFAVVDAAGWSDERMRTSMVATVQRPFDLARDPLVRVLGFSVTRHDHRILVVVHHIVTDLWSLANLADELARVYPRLAAGGDVELPELEVRYADFVRWQARRLAEPRGAAELEAWARLLDPPPTPLQLPISRPQPALHTERGESCSQHLGATLSEQLRRVAREAGVSLYTLLLAAFQTLLYRYSGQDDIVVGSPVSGRERLEFAGLHGFFANTVVIRQSLDGDPSFAELLAKTRETVIQALERQHVPFIRVVESVHPLREMSRNPLFQAMFVHHAVPLPGPTHAQLAAFALGGDVPPIVLGELSAQPLPLPAEAAQVDLALMSADGPGGLMLSLRYNADLLDKQVAQRMLGHLRTLLESIAADVSRPLSAMPMLTADERRQIDRWNRTDRRFEHDGWIHDAVAQQAARRPEACAVKLGDETLSYGELDARANQLANALVEQGIGRGSLVGIAAERSLALVVGLLGALKSGAAYLPLDLELPPSRLAEIARDAEPDVTLTLARHRPRLPEAFARVLCLDVDWPQIAEQARSVPAVELSGDDAAYVIYTSGSSGRPKGVINTHAAVLNRLAWMQDRYRCEESDRVLQKTPASFDVSVWEFFWPLMTGAMLVLARPGGHREPDYLVRLVQHEEITTVHFVPAMLRMFVNEPDAPFCRSLRRVICSGETLPASLVQRFFERVGCELHNLYGPTEAAIDVSSWECQREYAQTTVPIGRPIANVQIHILGRHGEIMPIGVPGELHIGGLALARGYLNRPELTAERFVADPFSTAAGARLYRTGDLARRLANGEIEYLGRLDSQIKLNGNRIELGEIEKHLVAHDTVREAVVIVHGNDGARRLAAYVTGAAGGRPDATELREFLAGRLPAYMVPSHIACIPELPLTSNGKVDRRGLPDPAHANRPRRASIVSPRTPQEQVLVDLFGRVLGIDDVDVHDNFFDLGGDSIRSLQLRALARDAGLDFTVADVFRCQTIDRLARAARHCEAGEHFVGAAPFALIGDADRQRLPADVVDAYPLSELQLGLVFHSETSPDYETYVMGFELAGAFDQSVFVQALARLATRHPVLRTSYELNHYEEALQLVHESALIPLEVFDLSSRSADEQVGAVRRYMASERWRKFDWTEAPLLRVAIHVGGTGFHCTFSHPLFDGWSMALLVTELFETYATLVRGEAVEPEPGLRLTYADFVAHERAAIASERERAFWVDYLRDASRGELPRWPRRHSEPSRHRRVEVTVNAGTHDGLQRLARETGTTLKSVLLAAHMRVVSVFSGQIDVTTGVIVNGRPEQLDGDRVAGLFLNTVPLRMRLDGGTWRDLVRQAYDGERELLPHRWFPGAELMRTVGGGQQLFDTAFNYIHFHLYKKLTAMEIRAWTNPSDQTYFPFTVYFHLDVATGALLCFLDYDESRVDPALLESLRGCYSAALQTMSEKPDTRYESRQLVPADNLEALLAEWNDTLAPWPVGWPRSVHRRVGEQAAIRPDAVAVTGSGRELTYAELDQRASQLANYLRRRDDRIGPGCTVGVALPRSPELLIALIATLRAGASYVPLDLTYPEERLRQVLDDSQAAVVLTVGSVAAKLPKVAATIVQLDLIDGELDGESRQAPDVSVDPEDLAYVIYTSGSTGTPKGVEIPHRALDNFLLAMEQELGWGDQESVLSLTTLSFDIAALELFLPLTTGGRVELATESEVRDPLRVMEMLAAGVTTTQATPATWRMVLDAGWAGQPDMRALCGGDALAPELADALRKRCRELWNVYGPTETTIWSTACRTR